jgi:hypothetical protein
MLHFTHLCDYSLSTLLPPALWCRPSSRKYCQILSFSSSLLTFFTYMASARAFICVFSLDLHLRSGTNSITISWISLLRCPGGLQSLYLDTLLCLTNSEVYTMWVWTETCPLVALWFGESYFNSGSISFSICEMGMIKVLSSWSDYRDKHMFV